MKKVLLAVFVLAGLVPYTSTAWGVSLNDAHDRYLDKRDMNFGQRREPKEKAEEKVEEKTREAGVESEAAKSQAQELTEEKAESGDEYDDPFEKAYAARQEAV